MWLTERGGRIAPAEINARFVAYRDALRLPKTLTPHSLRHSWVICTGKERMSHVGSAA
jgi:integrase/recombinase XerC